MKNYAFIVLEAELESLYKREFSWLIHVCGGEKAHKQRINDIEKVISIIKSESFMQDQNDTKH